MPIIAIVSGSYCFGEEIIRQVSQRLDYRQLDDILSAETAQRYNISKDDVEHILNGTELIQNKTSRKYKKILGYLETTLADLMLADNQILSGYAGYLIPGVISHIMKVCIIANHSFRVNQAIKTEGVTESEAVEKIQEYDEKISSFASYLTQKSAYDESLFDVMIPMHSTSIDEAVDIICKQAATDAVKTTDRSRRAAEDFLLSAKVKLELTSAGYEVNVFADNGHLNIEINEQSMRMGKLEKKIISLAAKIPGVQDVVTKLGPKAVIPSLNPWDNIELPPKIMLVDDEKEFVHTLSERLKTRSFESSIAYDGEQALEMLKDEIPDVIVLDIMMPGIDGIETLRRVKEKHPEIEIIILTGHGSDREQEMAEELGAFAYLHKPVNINDLAQKMKEAYAHKNR